MSCFCWLYRGSPSLAAKNIISLISVLTIWWCPCVKLSLVLLKKGVCYDQYVLGRILLAFALSHVVLQSQSCLLLQVSLDFLLLHYNLLWRIEHLFLVLVLGGLLGLHRTNQFQPLLLFLEHLQTPVCFCSLNFLQSPLSLLVIIFSFLSGWYINANSDNI